MLFAVVAPFFTTYLIRTLAWETILSDESPVVEVLKSSALAPSGHILATPAAVIPASPTTTCRSWCCRSTPASSGSTCADRGGEGPLRNAATAFLR